MKDPIIGIDRASGRDVGMYTIISMGDIVAKRKAHNPGPNAVASAWRTLPGRVYVYWVELEGEEPFLSATVDPAEAIDVIGQSRVVGEYEFAAIRRVSASVVVEQA